MSRQTPEATKRYREANKEKIRDYISRYGKLPENQMKRRFKYRHKIEYTLFHAAKQRAKKRDIEFNITQEDIIIPETCPILGIPIYVSEGKASDNSPTLDRIHPQKGYTKGNVRVISHRANSKKQDNTVEDFERFIAYMKGEI